LIPGLQASPKEFYATLENVIRQRGVPNTEAFRIDCPEGGPFSAKREYLRVRRKEYVFDICGAPFANGFFVSWWLGELPSGCLMIFGAIPVAGAVVRMFVRRPTYYRIDTGLMFQESIRGAVNDVIDQMTAAKGVRSLTEFERKPILREFRSRR
jgi:hypothetical protein